MSRSCPISRSRASDASGRSGGQLRDLGWLTINRVAAAKVGTTTSPRRREPKSAHVEDKTITRTDGTRITLRLYA